MDLWIIKNLAPLFYTVMELSIAAVCIGLGVLLLRKLADKRIPPVWKNALWLLVLVALVVPYRPSSNVAVIPSTEVNFRQQENSLHAEITQDKTELDGAYQVPAELTQQREDLHAKSLVFEVVIPAIWLLGMVVMMGILLATRQKMVRGMKATGHQPLLDDCKRQLNITQSVEIVDQSYLKSPALWGLFRPKILLPDYVAEMSEDSQKYILLHELSHLKHHDLWKNTLLLALQIVYWFNPLVWVLFRFIRQDMELLNDERVLKTLQKSEETPYAMSLIEVLGHANKLPLAPQMLCMVDNKENTKRRIQMIQLGDVFKKHKIIIAVGCLAVIAVLSALFLTAQPEAPDPGSTGNSKPITPSAYVYGNDAPALSPVLFLNEDGTYTYTASLVTSFAFHGDYTVDGTTLKLTDTVHDCQYTFQIVDDTLVLDLENSENPVGDIPDGVIFTLVDLDVLLEDINQPETPPTATPDPAPWDDTLILTLLAEIQGQDFIAREKFTVDGSDYTLHLSTQTQGDDLHGMAEVFDDTTLGEEANGDDFYYSTDAKVLKERDGGAATAKVGVLTPEGEKVYYLAVHTYAPTDMETLSRLISDACNQVTEIKTASSQATSDPAPHAFTLSVTEVTPTEIKFLSEPYSFSIDASIKMADWYSLEQKIDGQWHTVTEYGQEIASVNIPLCSYSWPIVFDTALESGDYRIGKELSMVYDDGTVDTAMYFAEFEIPEQELVGDPRLLTADELAYFNDNYFDILFEQEGYYVRFSEDTRMGDTVTLTFRGYEPDTGDVYEMIAEILTLEQVGDEYVVLSRDYAA